MAETFKLEGLRELEATLGNLPKATARAALVRAGKKALEPFIDTVRDLAPVEQGHLRDSYVIGTRLNKAQARNARKEGKNFAEVYAGTNDPAGVQNEFGNAHQAPQPHARPAWDATQAEVLDQVGELLWDEIDKAIDRLHVKGW